jgi:hypothetical protein
MFEHKGLTALLGAGIFLVVAVFVYVSWDHLPGTFRLDANGFPHGTGTERYFYRSGRLMLAEQYRAGDLKLSTWYRPDGSIIQVTDWQDGEGTGIYLRDDGSIRVRMHYVRGVADGKAIYYNPDGSVQREQWYSAGQPLASQPATATTPA